MKVLVANYSNEPALCGFGVTPYSEPVYRNRGKSCARLRKARSPVRFHSVEKSFCCSKGPTSRPWRDRRNAEQTKREECRRGRLRARQKGSGSCPRLMHPWSPEGHETRRSGSRKRKTKEEKEDEEGGEVEKEEEEAAEEDGEKKGPLTRWHTSTSISISRRHREAYRESVRMHLCALACAERASADAGLDNSLGTMSAAAWNLPNCRLGLAGDLRHFISYPTTSGYRR